MPQLFRDTVCLWANTTELEHTLAFVRDFRAATHTVLVGPSYFVANGPHGIRCLFEMGITDVILDLRLNGNPREIWQCVTSAAHLGVKGITFSAFAGRSNLENALNAAEASKAQTGRIKRPHILISPIPPHITDAELIGDLGLRLRHKEHIKQCAALAVAAGVDGILVEYEDMPSVKKVSRELAQLVYAQKKPHNYAEIEAQDVRKLPSITDILKAKAQHIIFDLQLVQCTDIEWCADMMLKELAVNQPKKRARIVY